MPFKYKKNFFILSQSPYTNESFKFGFFYSLQAELDDNFFFLSFLSLHCHRYTIWISVFFIVYILTLFLRNTPTFNLLKKNDGRSEIEKKNKLKHTHIHIGQMVYIQIHSFIHPSKTSLLTTKNCQIFFCIEFISFHSFIHSLHPFHSNNFNVK